MTPLKPLEDALEQKLKDVRLALYRLPDGSYTAEISALQMEFAEVSVVLRDDAERIAVRCGIWRSPHEKSDAHDIQELLQKVGGFVLVEVNERPNFSQILGERLIEVSELLSSLGTTIGAAMSFSNGTVLNFYVLGDNCYIAWGYGAAREKLARADV